MRYNCDVKRVEKSAQKFVRTASTPKAGGGGRLFSRLLGGIFSGLTRFHAFLHLNGKSSDLGSLGNKTSSRHCKICVHAGFAVFSLLAISVCAGLLLNSTRNSFALDENTTSQSQTPSAFSVPETGSTPSSDPTSSTPQDMPQDSQEKQSTSSKVLPLSGEESAHKTLNSTAPWGDDFIYFDHAKKTTTSNKINLNPNNEYVTGGAYFQDYLDFSQNFTLDFTMNLNWYDHPADGISLIFTPGAADISSISYGGSIGWDSSDVPSESFGYKFSEYERTFKYCPTKSSCGGDGNSITVPEQILENYPVKVEFDASTKHIKFQIKLATDAEYTVLEKDISSTIDARSDKLYGLLFVGATGGSRAEHNIVFNSFDYYGKGLERSAVTANVYQHGGTQLFTNFTQTVFNGSKTLQKLLRPYISDYELASIESCTLSSGTLTVDTDNYLNSSFTVSTDMTVNCTLKESVVIPISIVDQKGNLIQSKSPTVFLGSSVYIGNFFDEYFPYIVASIFDGATCDKSADSSGFSIDYYSIEATSTTIVGSIICTMNPSYYWNFPDNSSSSWQDQGDARYSSYPDNSLGGSESYPYLIETPAEFASLYNTVGNKTRLNWENALDTYLQFNTDLSGKYIKLAPSSGTFDFSGKEYLPINLVGQDGNQIHIDGNNATIKGLRLNQHMQSGDVVGISLPDSGAFENLNAGVLGVFGVLKNVDLKNLKLANIELAMCDYYVSCDGTIEGDYYMLYYPAGTGANADKSIELSGSLAGYTTQSTLNNIKVIDPYFQLSFDHTNVAIGGLVGYSGYKTSIINSNVNLGLIDYRHLGGHGWDEDDPLVNAGFLYIGGLTGYSYKNVILNSSSTDTLIFYRISSGGAQPSSLVAIGGLVGKMTVADPISLEAFGPQVCLLNSFSTAHISYTFEYDGYYDSLPELVKNFYAGGLVGIQDDTAINNYFAGTIEEYVRIGLYIYQPDHIFDEVTLREHMSQVVHIGAIAGKVQYRKNQLSNQAYTLRNNTAITDSDRYPAYSEIEYSDGLTSANLGADAFQVLNTQTNNYADEDLLKSLNSTRASVLQSYITSEFATLPTNLKAQLVPKGWILLNNLYPTFDNGELVGTWADPANESDAAFSIADSRYEDANICADKTHFAKDETCPVVIQNEQEFAYLNQFFSSMLIEQLLSQNSGKLYIKLAPQNNTFDFSAHNWIPLKLRGTNPGLPIESIQLIGEGTVIEGLDINTFKPSSAIYQEDIVRADATSMQMTKLVSSLSSGFFASLENVYVRGLNLYQPNISLQMPLTPNFNLATYLNNTAQPTLYYYPKSVSVGAFAGFSNKSCITDSNIIEPDLNLIGLNPEIYETNFYRSTTTRDDFYQYLLGGSAEPLLVSDTIVYQIGSFLGAGYNGFLGASGTYLGDVKFTNRDEYRISSLAAGGLVGSGYNLAISDGYVDRTNLVLDAGKYPVVYARQNSSSVHNPSQFYHIGGLIGFDSIEELVSNGTVNSYCIFNSYTTANIINHFVDIGDGDDYQLMIGTIGEIAGYLNDTAVNNYANTSTKLIYDYSSDAPSSEEDYYPGLFGFAPNVGADSTFTADDRYKGKPKYDTSRNYQSAIEDEDSRNYFAGEDVGSWCVSNGMSFITNFESFYCSLPDSADDGGGDDIPIPDNWDSPDLDTPHAYVSMQHFAQDTARKFTDTVDGRSDAITKLDAGIPYAIRAMTGHASVDGSMVPTEGVTLSKWLNKANWKDLESGQTDSQIILESQWRQLCSIPVFLEGHEVNCQDQLPQPQVSIDYQSEKLVFSDTEPHENGYTIKIGDDDPETLEVDETGHANITDGMFGKTVLIKRIAQVPSFEADSDELELAIPSRPDLTEIVAVNKDSDHNDSTYPRITGLSASSSYKYKRVQEETWQDVGSSVTEITSLAEGTYQIQQLATSSSFSAQKNLELVDLTKAAPELSYEVLSKENNRVQLKISSASPVNATLVSTTPSICTPSASELVLTADELPETQYSADFTINLQSSGACSVQILQNSNAEYTSGSINFAEDIYAYSFESVVEGQATTIYALADTSLEIPNAPVFSGVEKFTFDGWCGKSDFEADKACESLGSITTSDSDASYSPKFIPIIPDISGVHVNRSTIELGLSSSSLDNHRDPLASNGFQTPRYCLLESASSQEIPDDQDCTWQDSHVFSGVDTQKNYYGFAKYPESAKMLESRSATSQFLKYEGNLPQDEIPSTGDKRTIANPSVPERAEITSSIASNYLDDEKLAEHVDYQLGAENATVVEYLVDKHQVRVKFSDSKAAKLHKGEMVWFYIYSDPEYLGAATTSKDNEAILDVPENYSGNHLVAAFADDGLLLGWASVTLADVPSPDPDPVNPTPDNPTPNPDVPTPDNPATPIAPDNPSASNGSAGIANTGVSAFYLLLLLLIVFCATRVIKLRRS
ncbi:MAG: hypothetical protein LBI63_04685 [Candidatus Ancillula sp.]|nr:hypothetical protein [Candidatus Ancillula sp.]